MKLKRSRGICHLTSILINRIVYSRNSNFSTFSPRETAILSRGQHFALLAFPSTYSQIKVVLYDTSICNSRNPTFYNV